MKIVSVIRNRGQLTIPDSIRKSVSWINPLSAVTITVLKPDEIVIKPHNPKVDWDNLWKMIHKSRSISGKGRISGSEFLQKDRCSH